MNPAHDIRGALRKAKTPLIEECDLPDADVFVKLFNPVGRATWFITGSDMHDTMFGWADLLGEDMAELGYISIEELEDVKLPLGMKIEVDLYWKKKPLSEAKAELYGKTGG